MWNFGKTLLASLISVTLPLVTIPVYDLHAEPIPTEHFLRKDVSLGGKKQLMAYLDRDEVASALVDHGLSVKEARERIAALSDQEAAYLAGRIGDLPAGADGLSTVVGAIVLVFVILLVTDILGFTKVFPFTKAAR